MGDEDRRARWLLGVGTALGIGLAAFGIGRSGAPTAPGDGSAIAWVNGQPISRERFARFAAGVAAERKRVELDDETRRLLFERMLDEELLFQRGLALGLARHETTARRAIVAALVASITADAEELEPDPERLRSFHADNRERFTRPGRLSLEVAYVSGAGIPDALAFRRAQQIARRARAGEDLTALASELGDTPVAPLPAGPVPIETVRQYLGPTAAHAAEKLGDGEVGDPIRTGDGYHVLLLRERSEGEVAPFEAVRAEVRAEYLRGRGDQALRDYLLELREGADIRVLDPALAEAPGDGA